MFVRRGQDVEHILEYVGPAYSETLAEQPNWSTCGEARVASLLNDLADIAATKPPLPTASGPPKIYCPRSLDPDSVALSGSAAAAATSTAAASSSSAAADNFDELIDFVEQAAKDELPRRSVNR